MPPYVLSGMGLVITPLHTPRRFNPLAQPLEASQKLGGRELVWNFDGGDITSDGGALVLTKLAERTDAGRGARQGRPQGPTTAARARSRQSVGRQKHAQPPGVDGAGLRRQSTAEGVGQAGDQEDRGGPGEH